MSNRIETCQKNPQVCLTVRVEGIQHLYISGRLDFVIKCYEEWKKEYIHIYKNVDVDDFELSIEL